jgi:hypothetical protein
MFELKKTDWSPKSSDSGLQSVNWEGDKIIEGIDATQSVGKVWGCEIKPWSRLRRLMSNGTGEL